MKTAEKTPSLSDQYATDPGKFFFLRSIGREFKGIGYKTAATWVRRGVRMGRSIKAPRIKLASIKRGGSLMTTREAVEKFLRASDGG